MKVYVAGPYTQGHMCQNIRNALDVAEKLVAKGLTPFIPHLSHFWHLVHPHEREFWLKYDKEWLRTCDAFIRLPGFSPGADEEEALAKELGLVILDFALLKKGLLWLGHIQRLR